MDYKVLINKNNQITKQILNNIKLITEKNYLDEGILIEKKTYQMYLRLKGFLETIGMEIAISSAYRSIEQQEEIIEEFNHVYGEDYVNQYVALPGYSEHHTGLCLDLTLKIGNKYLENNEELFENVKLFEQIHQYLKDYGFILRYPKGKEKITGYSYEPWHIRYVGVHTANIMISEKLCLEEYHNKYNISGILIVNKPKGITSRDVDSIISKKFDTKKVGHTGTLDPLASGVLIVLLNKATKVSQDITSNDKEYIATVKVGVETDTLDVTGKVTKVFKQNRKIDLEKVLKSFQKTYLQEVPIYSAVKVNGKKLYQYARENISVQLPKKEVTIKEIELLEQDDDTFKFRCLVSKGTYIRSLIRDIGESVDIPMMMQDLVRTREALFDINDSFTLDEIEKDNYEIVSIENALNYQIILADNQLVFQIKNGMIVENIYHVEDRVIFKYNDEIIAVYEVDQDKSKLKCYKNFT